MELKDVISDDDQSDDEKDNPIANSDGDKGGDDEHHIVDGLDKDNLAKRKMSRI